MQTKHLQIKDMAYIAACSALMAVCAWICIPLAVPVTMQTFAMFVTAGLLGPKRGTIAVVIYILIGAVGLPVFSGLGAAWDTAGATGGYIAAFCSGAFTRLNYKNCGRRPFSMAFAMAVEESYASYRNGVFYYCLLLRLWINRTLGSTKYVRFSVSAADA
jgi:biotin transport system substrate-specific component